MANDKLEIKESYPDDISAVAEALKDCRENNLEAEVILYSLYHAKKSPASSIAECLNAGLMEWDI